MTHQPEHLDLRSEDIAGDRVQELLRLFPEVGTEGGQVDFDRLRLTLGEAVDVGKERYGMNWPGKAECFRTIQLPSLGTLLPCLEESVNFNTTENLILEGDNLEVLKLLQKSYLGKVKMIYIDPPYNTGNDFIYPDNFAESLQTYLEYTGQVDAAGKKFSTNPETDGRFHSKWLTMMYPRLYLARNLLREDGVMFVSIDDGEVDNLRYICDEIFGEENRVEIFVWQSIFRPSNMSKSTRTNGEFVLCYTRSDARTLEMVERREDPQGAASLTQNNNRARTLRFPASSLTISLPDGRYPATTIGEVQLHDDLIVRNGTNVEPFRLAGRFKWSQEYLDSEVAKGVTLLMRTTSFIPYYRKDYQRTALRPTKILPRDLVGDVLAANAELLGLLGSSMYDYPKPSTLVRFFAAAMGTATDDIILDFFAGSGTTAHAVLDLNQQDGGNRTFILVQLPEPTKRDDYPTVADITKERVRRVIKKLDEGDANKLDLDGELKKERGFRVFKLAESNFKPWNADVPHEPAALEAQLELHIDHIRQGRTNEDLLFEILLKSGFELATAVETLELAASPVYSVAGGALLVCLERELTLDLIRAIAQQKPERVVCLDEGFAGNDQLKANAVQLFKTQGVTTFRTV